MELTYTKRVTVQPEKVENVKVNLVDDAEDRHWGMFTSAGNKSISRKAVTLIKKLKKAKTLAQKMNALTAFLRSYRRMGGTKTMGESSDTAVRESVWWFFEKACEAIGMGGAADDIWESDESGY